MRLEQIFDHLNESPRGKICEGMKGLLKEGDERIGEGGEADVLDAGLIAAARRVEHYEIAAYGSARTYAELLGEREAVRLLNETLEEEKAADAKLSEADITAFCRKELAAYKVPKHVTFVDALPKSNVGKILRRELRGLK